jgi:cyclopropane fatty-acyl-phospholipid synthase-like methyltransferase
LSKPILPTDGVMLLQTITGLTGKQISDQGLPISIEMARFVKFIVTEIVPGGRLPSIDMVQEQSANAGFTMTRRHSSQQHYARTLACGHKLCRHMRPKPSSSSPRRSTSGT